MRITLRDTVEKMKSEVWDAPDYVLATIRYSKTVPDTANRYLRNSGFEPVLVAGASLLQLLVCAFKRADSLDGESQMAVHRLLYQYRRRSR